ncbi:MAG TPA: YeeE/YedE thiosulfate transporter family protein [Ignavibacteria bacterium]|nr:YeeE/YedE thiosulfate transporter family protein [Ignavibacteria bacterium]HMQ99281.1 YeeE/YedE thiosulfate transporter family protein [Ignavibacteria bacterium]
MLPIDVIAVLGKFGGYAVFVLIGIGFGVSLELAGFGDSRRLAAQFYLKDMTVLKTMFTGIIVAAILIFLASALGYLDFSQISVTQTFLWPGIVGGLIMGVGFIVGGYCPGTSLVSAASFKIDGLFFLIGTVLGAGLFGESLPAFEDFWNSSFTERYLVSDWLGWSIGATLFAVVVMALAMFYGAEKTEEFFRNKGKDKPWSWKISKRSYLAGSMVLLVTAAMVWIIGQPDPVRKWSLMEGKYAGQLAARDVFIHPLEYVKTYNEASIKLVTLDLRSENEFRTFHLSGSENAKPEDFLNPGFVGPLSQLPSQGVVVLIADNDSVSVQAWKYLKVQGVNNVYILENGLKNWNSLFEGKTISGKTINTASPPSEVLQLFPKDAYSPKIKISTKKRSGGLCS